MRRRAFAGGLILLAVPDLAEGAPAPVTAEQAVAAQQEALHNALYPPCHNGGEEIVVCGRRNEQERLPLRNQRIMGARTHLLPGETASAVTAMNSSDPPCNSAGAPRCGFSISFIAAGIVAYKVGKHLIDPDSDPPPTPIPSAVPPPD